MCGQVGGFPTLSVLSGNRKVTKFIFLVDLFFGLASTEFEGLLNVGFVEERKKKDIKKEVRVVK